MEKLLVPYEAAHDIEGDRAMVLAPHPDDEVFGCSGAIMRHITRGSSVRVVIVTDGTFSAGKANLGSVRRAESEAAGVILGYGVPEFWGMEDRGLAYGEQLVQRIVDAVEAFGPDVVYAPSLHEMHPDHRALAMAALEAVRRDHSQIKLAMYEVGVPMPRPSLLLDISDLIDRKHSAMACFGSQLQHQAYDKQIVALNRFRTYTLGPQVIAAEAYSIVHSSALKNNALEVYASEYQRQRQLGLAVVPCDVPLVSVIIRSMNRASLSESLDSVALQTYPNIEVILVNAKGCEHREIEQWCGRFPLKFVSLGEKLLRSRAANVGLDNARGEYLVFLDDDDLFEPDHIASMAEALGDSKSCLASYAGVRIVNKSGLITGVYNQTFSAARFMGGNFIPIHAVLFKRELVLLGCKFDESLESYEDWDFWLQATQYTDFVPTHKISAIYRVDLGESGMAVATPEHSHAQQQARLAIWTKWWPKWRANDFDNLIDEFHKQSAQSQEQLTHADQIEKELRKLLLSCLNDLTNRAEEIDTLNTELADRKKQTTTLQQEIEVSNEQIAVFHQVMGKKDAESAALSQEAAKNHAELMQLRASIHEILASNSWKLGAPFRFLSRGNKYLLTLLKTTLKTFYLFKQYSEKLSVNEILKRAIFILRTEKTKGIKLRLQAHDISFEKPHFSFKVKTAIPIEEHKYQPLSTIEFDKYEFFFFDVFDTAIIRFFLKPTDLFEYISFDKNSPEFHLQRIKHEELSRASLPNRKDITIDDIYTHFTVAAIDDEIATEMKFCVTNPDIYNFYLKILNKGKKIYFVSDMYLDKSTVCNILHKNGYSTYEDVYVSSEDDLIKGDGSRFEWLKKTIPDCMGASIHIGDNLVSDFLQPKANGFEAHHYIDSLTFCRQDTFLNTKFEFLNSKRSLGLSFLISVFRYWKTELSDQETDYWRQFGFFYGGALVSAFCGFINEQITKKNLSCSKIYFLARDGDIMSQVYELLHDNFKPVYLLASRRCMSFPSLCGFTQADDIKILDLYTTPIGINSVDDIMDRFCYNDMQSLESDLIEMKNSTTRWTDNNILECFLKNQKLLMEKVKSERESIKEYLSNVGFFDEKDIVIVDVGWGGSIQNCLSKLAAISGYRNTLNGIYIGVNENSEQRQNKVGFLFDGDRSQFTEYLNLIELITASPKNGVVRIENKDGNFYPVSGKITADEILRQSIATEIQSGILSFAKIIKKFGIENLNFIRPEDFRMLFLSLQECASEEDVLQLQKIRHATTLGMNYKDMVLHNTNI